MEQSSKSVKRGGELCNDKVRGIGFCSISGGRSMGVMRMALCHMASGDISVWQQHLRKQELLCML